MEYRVEELAAAAGLRVDTIRFYQAKGLLPPPKRVKRVALYSDAHFALLKRIRQYQSQGLSLAVIKRLLGAASRRSRADALLAAVAEQSGERSLTRQQLAALSGVPEPLLASIESAGLLEPLMVADEPRYGEADLQMARAGLEILPHGFPLDELLRLAMRHAKGVREVADAAIDLFDRYVRKMGTGSVATETVADAFRRLLPALTTLVALHFQRTLLNRALAQLRQHGDAKILQATTAVLREGQVEVKWR
jgi:DNA-binding transcriptional MerR regulator